MYAKNPPISYIKAVVKAAMFHTSFYILDVVVVDFLCIEIGENSLV